MKLGFVISSMTEIQSGNFKRNENRKNDYVGGLIMENLKISYIISFTKSDIDQVFEESDSIYAFIINAHKKILGQVLWDKLEQLGDYIYCNGETNKYITKKVINKYGMLQSMNWMNKGFSILTKKKLKDFEFDIENILKMSEGKKNG
jgi:hypothetical protein